MVYQDDKLKFGWKLRICDEGGEDIKDFQVIAETHEAAAKKASELCDYLRAKQNWKKPVVYNIGMGDWLFV